MKKYWVAFSGGLDSHVLLHFLKTEFPELAIQAIHINHQLLPQAVSWEKHCKLICHKLNIPLKIIRVKIHKKPGKSLEALAREARYAAFKKNLKPSDILFTAHHQDDQAETVLLQLFRGAGLRGVSAMPAVLKLDTILVLRPFLNFTRENLLSYARENKLHWIEDPSNQNNHFDRNYLRNTIFPELKKRWPEITKTLNRFAKHCAEQEKLLSHQAGEIHEGHEKNIIRQLILKNKLDLPSEKVLNEIVKIYHTPADKNPIVRWGNNQCRKFKHQLYFSKIPQKNTPLLTPKNITWLKKYLPYDITDKNIVIKYRTGGEKILLNNQLHHKSLKNLFQEWGIPPWERDKIPLIYYKNKLIAITGYIIGKV